MPRAEDAIEFYGHPQVLATHRTTFEVTKKDRLTPRGDCVIGVRATKACRDLDEELKLLLGNDRARVLLAIEVGGMRFEVAARGDCRLTLTHEEDVVVRRSDFVCPRTLVVRASAAASDVPREIVRALRNPSTKGTLVVRAEL